MRDDTQLVFVDIPGVNEAGSSELYLDYVRDMWDGFDVVIVVMDAIQGVNTEEQVQLLKFVKDNQDKRKEVPVIILANKVDDPDDEEIKTLVEEVRLEVERIFDVQDRDKMLHDILNDNNEADPKELRYSSPVFIPISAENGFLYRAASHMKPSNFDKLDMAYIDKIGHEEIGKFKWKKLTREQKYDAIYKVVSDPDQYKERLEASNFDTFLSTLDHFIGGDMSQKYLIGKQLDVATKKLTQTASIADSLLGIFEKYKAIDKPTAPLKNTFWSLHTKCYEDACKSFSNLPTYISKLHRPMKEVLDYSQGLHKKLYGTCSSSSASGKEKDSKRIIQVMKELIKMQCDVILEKKLLWTDLAQNNRCRVKVLTWRNMSPRDWAAVINSILLMAHSKHFCENFGKEIIDLQWVLLTVGSFCFIKACSECKHSNCTCSTKSRVAKTQTCDIYHDMVQIQVPENLEDPNHWGHLAWAYCQFMESKKKGDI
eukprot:15366459-Ditylum_brightwellii.AAC.1